MVATVGVRGARATLRKHLPLYWRKPQEHFDKMTYKGGIFLAILAPLSEPQALHSEDFWCHPCSPRDVPTSQLDQAEKGGIVPRRRNLWHRVDLVNLGALISKIDVIREN